jgi:hypothetical protein
MDAGPFFERLTGFGSLGVSSGSVSSGDFFGRKFLRPSGGVVRTSRLVGKWHSTIRKSSHRRASGRRHAAGPICFQGRTRGRGFGTLSGYVVVVKGRKKVKAWNCEARCESRTSDREGERYFGAAARWASRLATQGHLWVVTLLGLPRSNRPTTGTGLEIPGIKVLAFLGGKPRG